MRLTTRADLNTGLICNLRCRFCYDLDHLNQKKGPSLEDLRRRMVLLNKSGIDTLDLTGGEATVRKDLIDIIRMAKEEFGMRQICLITNGFRLADPAYMNAVLRAGINEFLFSIHGASAEIHDDLAGIKGSFDRVLQALKQADQAGVKLRVNTTVTAKNYTMLNEIASLISASRIENYNLILYNPILDAGRRVDQLAVRYSEAAPFLKKVVDQYRHCFEHLHVKYIPFCLMQGYERYVMNLLQASYIPYEWDFCLRAKLRRGVVLYGMAVAAGFFLCMDLRAGRGRSFREMRRDAFIHFQEMTNKYKPRSCQSCRYNFICPGLWREYRRVFGTDELIAVQGEPIFRPYHFYEAEAA